MDFNQIYSLCSPFTMTSIERMRRLYESVISLNIQGIPGDFVECGVFKGGSAMNMACTQLNFDKRPTIHLYDTFAGMTSPTDYDVDYMGNKASELIKESHYMARCGLKEVMSNMVLTGYPEEFIKYHQGDVCLVLPKDNVGSLSLLRLDTDWYESTKIELEILYPKLVIGGVLIVDDYGHFSGSKKATDDYFSSLGISPQFEHIDYTGVLHIKSR